MHFQENWFSDGGISSNFPIHFCAYVKSNAVVLVAGGQAVGIGAGQQSRVDAGDIATARRPEAPKRRVGDDSLSVH